MSSGSDKPLDSIVGTCNECSKEIRIDVIESNGVKHHTVQKHACEMEESKRSPVSDLSWWCDECNKQIDHYCSKKGQYVTICGKCGHDDRMCFCC